jgi:hypothetical protein
MSIRLRNANHKANTKTADNATKREQPRQNKCNPSHNDSDRNWITNLRLLNGCDEFHIRASRGLTTREPSRAGPATMANLHHLDELRCPPGSDSGEVVRPIVHLLNSQNKTKAPTNKNGATPATSAQ